jgi:hypothetical protein
MNQTEQAEAVIPMEAASAETTVETAEEISAGADSMTDPSFLAEVEAVRAVYPDFDPAAALEHPVLGELMRGQVKPTLRQLYEAVHLEDILENRVTARVQAQVAEEVSSAVADAVAAAVRETEERLLANIRARGQRPAEVGAVSGAGIRMHPAVNRLTRRERAMLAKRAENGETIQF